MTFRTWVRESYMANTDPQRRCYDGCNFSEEKRWTEWQPLTLAGDTREEAEKSLASWKYIGRKTCQFELREEV